jgi:alpha-tubulin suppressor-like RCC1 family protein
VTVGATHTCARLGNEQLRCWGGNAWGQLGDGTTVDRHLPAPVRAERGPGPLVEAVEVAAGGSHTCANAHRQGANAVRTFCWGANGRGQLGDHTTIDRRIPRLVREIPGHRAETYQDLGLGLAHTCGQSVGHAFCWGANDNGQLGDGTTTDSPFPVEVVGTTSAFLNPYVGARHACRLWDRNVTCWGDNAFGQLGDGTTTDRPTAVYVLG